ncbi:unnamed protein product [Spirodela intermedia]|uniref:Uncharacterized protein n=1 Tax=Spirodela intermedia TaxID=51605 RepID=A0A7I8L223_SPIIN|nr:unnamed protein product [Spirodela intermedia]
MTSDQQSSAVLTSMELESSMGVGIDKLPPKPKFAALSVQEMVGKMEFRRIPKNWMGIYTPVYEQMKIDTRMNRKARKVELKTRQDAPEVNLQKCADFVHTFMLGFDIADSFEIQDVKMLQRAIGRLSGKGGESKIRRYQGGQGRSLLSDLGREVFRYGNILKEIIYCYHLPSDCGLCKEFVSNLRRDKEE